MERAEPKAAAGRHLGLKLRLLWREGLGAALLLVLFPLPFLLLFACVDKDLALIWAASFLLTRAVHSSSSPRPLFPWRKGSPSPSASSPPGACGAWSWGGPRGASAPPWPTTWRGGGSPFGGCPRRRRRTSPPSSGPPSGKRGPKGPPRSRSAPGPWPSPGGWPPCTSARRGRGGLPGPRGFGGQSPASSGWGRGGFGWRSPFPWASFPGFWRTRGGLGASSARPSPRGWPGGSSRPP